jgi:hypothetical protein
MFGQPQMSPLAQALMNRAPAPRLGMGAAAHIPKASPMAMPRPRPYARPVMSGLRPAALMPKFGIGFQS